MEGRLSTTKSMSLSVEQITKQYLMSGVCAMDENFAFDQSKTNGLKEPIFINQCRMKSSIYFARQSIRIKC